MGIITYASIFKLAQLAFLPTDRACRSTGISIPSARYRWWL